MADKKKKKKKNTKLEEVYKGCEFISNSNLYDICFKTLFLCFEDSDICYIIIQSTMTDKLAVKVEDLFSAKCQRIYHGDDIEYDYHEYMTVKNFKKFFLKESNLFRLLIENFEMEIKIYKNPADIEKYHRDRSKSEHVSLTLNYFNVLAFELQHGVLKNSSCEHYFVENYRNNSLFRYNWKWHAKFYLSSSEKKPSLISIYRIRIGKSNDYQIKKIIKKVDDILSKDISDIIVTDNNGNQSRVHVYGKR
ncbi:hypothetical protein [Bartonella sp. HY038]|uniref:hypothetical protein n=1 Tax=Bartonella sp. HY038 TaxID=2759660 RepID=UPI0015F9158B|nr:hypothetical protein [Bartonella sp. HY038]